MGQPKHLHVIQVPALPKDKDRKDANVNVVKKGCWMISLLKKKGGKLVITIPWKHSGWSYIKNACNCN